MKIRAQDIKREIRVKAVLLGFLTYFILEWVIAGIVGGGWGLFSFYKIVYPYMKRCMPNCDTAAMEKYIDTAIAPYEIFLTVAGTLASLTMIFLMPVAGGYVAGRRAKTVEITNSAVLGTILIVYSIVHLLWLDNHLQKVYQHSTIFTPGTIATIIFTIPLVVLGGILARMKNNVVTSQPSLAESE